MRKDPPLRICKDHPSTQVIGNLGGRNLRGNTRKNYKEMVKLAEICQYVSSSCFVSLTEPKNVKEALKDDFWVEAMQDELHQFKPMKSGS